MSSKKITASSETNTPDAWEITSSALDQKPTGRGIDVKSIDTDYLLTQIALNQQGMEENLSPDSQAVGAGSSIDHILTAITTIRIREIHYSATDVAKVEIFFADDGAAFVSRCIDYIETESLDGAVTLKDFIELPPGGKCKVTKTNRRASGAQTINSTIVYNLVPVL